MLRYLVSGVGAIHGKFPLRRFDTENLQQMAHMFHTCTKLAMLDLSSFATPNMTSMLCAFQYCKNLKAIYVTSAFTTDKVTEGPQAFAGCVNLPNYNPDKTGVEMAHTGAGGYLTAATASWVRWDAPTGTLSFHRSATKPAGDNILDLGYGNYPNWDTHAAEIKKVVFKAGFRDETHTTCSNWFNGCTNLTSIEGIENLNTSNVKNMSGMFALCSNLETLDLSHFNTEKVTTMAQMWRRGNSPWIAPAPLTKYLSTTEHEERQVTDSMHLCPQPLYL